MDVRRELDLINKHFNRHYDVAGEPLIWFEFIRLGDDTASDSVYDDVYDEGVPGTGGRQYRPGVVVPTLLMSENEDQRRAISEGRQSVQTMDMFIPLRAFREAGISEPHEYRQHLNDMFLYDGRYYNVFDYRVRGRLRDEVFILVQGQETFVDQEMVFDPGPPIMSVNDLPWPADLPVLG